MAKTRVYHATFAKNLIGHVIYLSHQLDMNFSRRLPTRNWSSHSIGTTNVGTPSLGDYSLRLEISRREYDSLKGELRI